MFFKMIEAIALDYLIQLEHNCYRFRILVSVACRTVRPM